MFYDLFTYTRKLSRAMMVENSISSQGRGKVGLVVILILLQLFRTGKAELMFIASYLTGLNSEFDNSHNVMR